MEKFDIIIYSAQQPIDSADNDNIYELILKTLCRRIAKLQIKLMHNLTYEIKAKCSTGNYKIRAGRMSCEELTKRKNEGKYMCKDDNKFHSSEAIENTWLKYAAVKDVETACVKLEIKIDELVAKGIHILSMKEIEEINENSRVFILSPDQLVDFLHFQNSIGKIVYFDVPHLRSYVIINSLLLEEVKKCFVTALQGLIIPDIATSVRDCLFVTLERISEFYQSTIHCKANNKLPFHTEYSCSKLNCFTPEENMVVDTEECLCEHGENIKHNWRVWNQKLVCTLL
ncbi:unnamed protein product [Mytilus edulis]|uniref:Uncharacterized protein n=1 Tax=Mytilus edulis TaxID=6550 RepID=A0A8S3PPV1_MYTED|nr:unnamed protein product [Mytilus edulis]